MGWFEYLIWGPGGRRRDSASTGTTRPPATDHSAPNTTRARDGGAPITPPRMGARIPATRAAGGRVSQDAPGFSFGGSLPVIAAPPDYENAWRTYRLDAKTLERQTPAVLLEMLADLSPDVSRALWDFLRLCNPGWECKAYRPGGKEEDTQAQAVLDAFLDRLDDQHGAIDVVFGRLFMGPFLRGSMVAELVLDTGGREGVDLATPDPAIIRFRRVDDPARGQIWQKGQWQRGQWVSLDVPTVRYIAVDPFPGSPYGRPMASPALFTTLFVLGLLHDLRRVVAQQGYPRIDIAVSMQTLMDTMPSGLANDAEAWKAWVNAVVAEVQTVYSQLEPDDAYVHTDVISVNKPVGTVDSHSLGAVDGLLKALERMAVRALKSNSLLMGNSEGLSEASANRLWEVHLQSIKSLQHYAETLLERLLGVLLRAQGMQARVEFRFAENRASEVLRDRQAEALLIDNAARKRDEGWISQDEAAQEVVKHDAELPEPIAVTAAKEAAKDAAALQAEPGSNRSNGSNGHGKAAERLLTVARGEG